jgi:hypothetical protein
MYRGPMKLALVRESDIRRFQCSNCDEPGPIHNPDTQRWLKSELGAVKCGPHQLAFSMYVSFGLQYWV